MVEREGGERSPLEKGEAGVTEGGREGGRAVFVCKER
jgi:hypothetical protein